MGLLFGYHTQSSPGSSRKEPLIEGPGALLLQLCVPLSPMLDAMTSQGNGPGSLLFRHKWSNRRETLTKNWMYQGVEVDSDHNGHGLRR